MRLRLRIAYDGAPFCGWQSQTGGGSVQDHLATALGKIAGGPITLHGAGRTDAGVHALGQVAHADVPDGRTPATWLAALNGNLPPQIRVLAAARARPEFHARFSATGKLYRYRLCTHTVLPPHELGRAWHLPIPINRALLAAASARLVGRHDFRKFSANRGTPVADTVRALHRISSRRRHGVLEIDFEGDGFLYKMVRLLTGTLVRIASGKEPVALIDDLLGGHGRPGAAAPAHGLWLMKVHYGGGPR
jgi:tRNA pseudouridine38-40 synthase